MRCPQTKGRKCGSNVVASASDLCFSRSMTHSEHMDRFSWKSNGYYIGTCLFASFFFSDLMCTIHETCSHEPHYLRVRHAKMAQIEQSDKRTRVLNINISCFCLLFLLIRDKVTSENSYKYIMHTSTQ